VAREGLEEVRASRGLEITPLWLHRHKLRWAWPALLAFLAVLAGAPAPAADMNYYTVNFPATTANVTTYTETQCPPPDTIRTRPEYSISLQFEALLLSNGYFNINGWGSGLLNHVLKSDLGWIPYTFSGPVSGTGLSWGEVGSRRLVRTES
jgi:hypothetical protein